MLKVFLVEDEFIVREGIKNNIDWAGEGFRFCGDAADGELAYPLIQSEQPDIVITDIRMPFMDGLELSRLLRNELPQSKIIILSGHEEFRYAQEAIKIGVAEYLLKPINGAELLKVVKRVAKQITLDRLERENLERYRREMEENETDIKRKLFNNMIAGSISIASILERSKELGLELGAQYYQVVLFKYSAASDDEAYSNEQMALVMELERFESNRNIILFDRGVEGLALLVKGDTPEQLEAARNAYLAGVKELMDRHPMIRYFGGIGSVVSRIAHLSDSFESASRAFSYRFILDRSAIISILELPRLRLGAGCDSSEDMLEAGNFDLKNVEAFLRNGEEEEITFFVEEFFRSIGSAGEKSVLFRQYIVMKIYFTVLAFLKEISGADAAIDEPFKRLDGMKEISGDAKEVRDYVIRVLATAIQKRDAIRNKRYHRMIEQAKEYINEHYVDEDISLNDTAAYVNISPSYFSAVFSRETGSSFIRYLTDLRMNKAKELLKLSDMRCSDISMAVGYKDPHYFSYLFKKLQNCSPIQYRASNSL